MSDLPLHMRRPGTPGPSLHRDDAAESAPESSPILADVVVFFLLGVLLYVATISAIRLTKKA